MSSACPAAAVPAVVPAPDWTVTWTGDRLDHPASAAAVPEPDWTATWTGDRLDQVEYRLATLEQQSLVRSGILEDRVLALESQVLAAGNLITRYHA